MSVLGRRFYVRFVTNDTNTAVAQRPSVPETGTRWWRRPWVLPLAAIAVLFVAFSLPRYLTFDPAQSRVQQPEIPVHYPLLVAHVIFGSIAMLTCCLQVWPRFRRTYPSIHRLLGRVYIFAGVAPAGVSALALAATTPFGPVTMVSNGLLATIWLGCTAAGFRAARQRRYADHRRWMIRSFVLTLSIITNRLWIVPMSVLLAPRLETSFGGNEELLEQAVSAIVAWLGWTLPLLAAQYWLDRDPRGKGSSARRPSQPRPSTPDRANIPKTY